YPGVVEMAAEHREVVERGLALRSAWNAIMQLLGGRSIHPVNVRIGGFYRCPSNEELGQLRPELEHALGLAEATVRFVAKLPFPDLEEDYEFVALSHPDEYGMNEGEVVSSRGTRLSSDRFEDEFEERQVPHSNALQSVHKGHGSYLVGPLARYAINHDRLGARAKAIAREVGLPAIVRNPYQSIVVRAVEVVYALEESLRIIDAYRPPDAPYVPPPTPLPAATGAAVTEAPRGMLFHRYRLAAGGLIEEAKIVAPTSQNQKRIGDDVRHLVTRSLRLSELTDACERAIRNHDPCISCATHFLNLTIERV
ncbi:MAG: nickel-dependent hydrogenase large subunit, partial [Thermoplasmata archaeon]|nr:nickel-dependent hydrogenase large subunit [Thermoplasmata archaeon]